MSLDSPGPTEPRAANHLDEAASLGLRINDCFPVLPTEAERSRLQKPPSTAAEEATPTWSLGIPSALSLSSVSGSIRHLEG